MYVGLKFWKSPRCKIFADPVKDLQTKSCSTNKKRHSIMETDSDSDEPTTKRLKDDTAMRVEHIESNVEDLNVVDSVKPDFHM